jgi:molecular chaperone GrpE
MKDNTHEMEPQDDIELTGEDNIDDPELEEIERSSSNKIKTLQAKLKQCEAEKTDLQDNLQRTKAEFLNAKKRLEEEMIRENERAVEKHIQKLIPLCDSFQMAMSNAEAWNAIDAQWRKGVESIKNQLDKILQSYGVSELVPLDQDFDPNLHEAMAEVPVTEADKDHTVVAVIQNGYMREHNGRQTLIRPARVSVGVFHN